jgi:hypothetical protein
LVDDKSLGHGDKELVLCEFFPVEGNTVVTGQAGGCIRRNQPMREDVRQ